MTITTPFLAPSDPVLRLLSHSYKFIPTPKGCCHNFIIKGLNDFIRKYKWHHVFLHRTPRGANVVNRFSRGSDLEPPSNIVPEHIQRRCQLMRHMALSKLRSCHKCFPGDNLSPAERTVLNSLVSEKRFVVSPVDKGGGWFVAPTDEYRGEAFRQLSNDTFYSLCDKSLAHTTAAKLTQLLNHLRTNRFINKREFRFLAPPDHPRERSFYLLPKVHKSDWPTPCMPRGRPIVSDVKSVSRNCASLVEHFLAPIARSLPSYVRDSMHAISLIKNFVLPNDALLFTLDVTSLYTNIPHEDGIASCSRAFLRYPDAKRPDLSILTMLRIILTSNDFSFCDERFLQTHGTAMGCAFGSSYASIFLSEWEERILQFEKAPILWLRYIDDVFGVWPFPESDFLLFVHAVNKLNSNIQVTTSHSPCNIRFLDLEIYRVGERCGYRTGFKPTDSFRVLTRDSFHPPHVFKSIIFGHLYRFLTHSSTYTDFLYAKRRVVSFWREQGYSRGFIRNCTKAALSFTGQSPTDWRTGFFPCSTCNYCKYGFYTDSVREGSSFYCILHRLSCSDINVIYMIECKSCHVRYVGETSRKLRTRISEHVNRILNRSPNSVAQHFTSLCSLSDFSFTVLERCKNSTRRKFKEERWMRRLNSLAPHGLNTLGLNKKTLHLVVPFSACSDRVIRVCQRVASDVTTVGSRTSARNLRSLLTPKPL